MYADSTHLYFAANGKLIEAIDSTGRMGLGNGTIDTSSIVTLNTGSAGNPLSGTSQIGYRVTMTSTSAATVNTSGILLRANTAAASYTCTDVIPLSIVQDAAGATSTITRYTAIRFTQNATSGSTGNAFIADNTAYTGNYFINSTITDETLISGNLRINTAGKGLLIKEGTNAKMGTTTLNGITAVTVNTTAVTATSRIFLTIQASGGTVGSPYVDTRSAGTSFNIKSTNAADTSTVAWMIVEPA
jgi:hypothetical protein